MTSISPENPLPISPSEYGNQLRDFIDHEKDVERENNRETLTSNSLQTLRQMDIGFLPYAQPLGGIRRIQMRVQPAVENPDDVDIRDDYGLFEDCEILVQCCQYEEGEQNDAYEVVETLTGTIGRINNGYITVGFPELAVSQDRIDEANKTVSECDFVHVGELLNPTVFNREEKAVRGLNERVLAYFSGNRDVEFAENSRALRESERKDDELYENRNQSEAISRALTAEGLTCIQGPPGTGKTRVIVELVRRCVEAGLTVLVTAESHQAVGNILVGDSSDEDIDEHCLHYHKRIHGFPLVRVNPKHDKMSAFEQKRYGLDQPSISSPQSEGGIVYVSTNNSAARLGNPSSNPFDVAIVDEATQSRQSSTCIPISRTEKTILVGDHKQLGPERPFTPDDAGEPPELDFDAEESSFTHLYGGERGVYGNEIGVKFDQQYRMHTDIAGFPSEEFYDGDLTTAVDRTCLNNLQPILAYHVENRDSIDTERNQAEAEAVSDYLSKLVSVSGVSPNNIGIATAYRNQVPVLQTAMEQCDFNHKPILVQTFDAFQGSEREVMILSFVRSNSHGNIGFLGGETGERRLNVAMTRAKHHCAMFGDWDTLAQGSGLYARLRDYIQRTGMLIE
ncbi:DNA helicase protein [Halorhabdus tiamatea SARL4B]|uniref:DNA helicase protein n=1 Tax=Halorhabdus tiamatea SARL4B TaxID=1033806 RepID=U2DGG4_9EURY|nr:AAA domain-containing protein [Halorhabdus tiamatea]ERJ05107.1 DNA helicase protein [Halorhabdus tiamatea SARL4B]